MARCGRSWREFQYRVSSLTTLLVSEKRQVVWTDPGEFGVYARRPDFRRNLAGACLERIRVEYRIERSDGLAGRCSDYPFRDWR